MTASLTPVLTPHGHLRIAQADDAPELPDSLSERLQRAFARGHGHGLLQLGAGEVKTPLPALFGYWREFGARYVTAVCTLPATGDSRVLADVLPPPAEEVAALALSAPPMTGAEYLTPSVLQALWDAIDTAFRVELAESVFWHVRY